MSKIKILYIIGSSNIGGAEKMLCSLLKYLDKDRFEAYVACPPEGLMVKDFKRFAKEVNVVDMSGIISGIKAVFSLKRYMKARQIDIVHTHLFSADLIGIIAARLASIPCVIATIHGYNFRVTGVFSLRNIKNYACSLLYKALYVYCSRLTAVSHAVREDLVNRGWARVSPKKIELVFAAVDFEETVGNKEIVAEKHDHIFADNAQKYIGVIANFDRVKGHRVLLKAMPAVLKKMPNIRFLLTGTGEDEEYIKKGVKKAGIQDNVIFLGVVENTARIVYKCDIIVLPSLSEGLPLVVIEAMLFGKPVIASNVGGVPELIKNNENGILVQSSDHNQLSEAVLEMLKDGSKAYLLGQNGKNMIYSEFGSKFRAQEMTRGMETVYQVRNV